MLGKVSLVVVLVDEVFRPTNINVISQKSLSQTKINYSPLNHTINIYYINLLYFVAKSA